MKHAQIHLILLHFLVIPLRGYPYISCLTGKICITFYAFHCLPLKFHCTYYKHTIVNKCKFTKNNNIQSVASVNTSEPSALKLILSPILGLSTSNLLVPGVDGG